VILNNNFSANGALLFTDVGFKPTLSGNEVTLGPEQIALVGYGDFADSVKYNFGLEKDIIIPEKIEKLSIDFRKTGKNKYEAVVENYNSIANIRISCSQKGTDGNYYRVGENQGLSAAKLIKLTATQNGKQVPVKINYDKKLWSGISWATGEIENKDILKNKPLIINYILDDTHEINFEGNLYKVIY
jgi:hypothetical protein